MIRVTAAAAKNISSVMEHNKIPKDEFRPIQLLNHAKAWYTVYLLSLDRGYYPMSLYHAHVCFEFILKSYLASISGTQITTRFLKEYNHNLGTILKKIDADNNASSQIKDNLNRFYNKYKFFSAKQESFKYIPIGTGLELLLDPISEFVSIFKTLDAEYSKKLDVDN